MNRLADLAAAGLNAVHLLPVNDIGTIEERRDAQAEPQCNLESFAPDSEEQQALDVLVLQWRAKRPRNNLRSAFYDMKNSSRSLMGSQIPATIRNRSFVLGWSSVAVDKLNRRCNLEGFYDENGEDLDALGLDEIIVTGTRIVRDAYSPSPGEFMSGQVKSNNIQLLMTFQKVFQLVPSARG